jgi:hypothetical protein
MNALKERHRLSRELRRLHPDRLPGRKTSASLSPAAARRPEMPDWRLRFALPASFGFGFVPGPIPDVTGVALVKDPSGALTVEIIGKNAQWLCDRAAAFVQKYGRTVRGQRIQATMTREAGAGTHGLGPRTCRRAPRRRDHLCHRASGRGDRRLRHAADVLRGLTVDGAHLPPGCATLLCR